MPQSYTLRLFDGTVLQVDYAGLGTWLADGNALVRPPGSSQWMPLRKFLAEERSAARRTARVQPKPPSTPRDALPLVYPEQQPSLQRTPAPPVLSPNPVVPSEIPVESAVGDEDDAVWMALPELAGRKDEPVAPLDPSSDDFVRRGWRVMRLWLTPRTATAPDSERTSTATGAGSPEIYSPRLSADDGLPILVLEPQDDRESADASLPEVVLEPLADEQLAGRLERASASAPRRVARPAGGAAPARQRRVRSRAPWSRRLVVTSGLAAGGLFAFFTSPAWFPGVVAVGQMVGSGIQQLEQSSDSAKKRREAQQQAIAQLPLLAPETVRMVLATSTAGALDPPAVFQLACNAADRGSWALTLEEAQELQALRRQLLDALLPWEAQRLLDYESARVRRATLPFENRAALDLVARGTNALPAQSRARLQALFGKAVAAEIRAQRAPGS